MEEQWKDIPGLEGRYQVSSFGQVRSVRDDGSFYIRKLIVNGNKKRDKGYLSFNIKKNGKHVIYRVHRLVAELFVSGKTAEKNQVNHKDENTFNNRADNLEWCTCSYNIRYRDGVRRRWQERLRRGARWPNPPRPVEAWRDGVLVGHFRSLAEAAAFCGRSKQAVWSCCMGKTSQCAGYQWRYAESPKD